MADDLVDDTPSSPSVERWFSRQRVDLLLNGDYLHSFNKPDYFSDDGISNGHVFDVINGNGGMKLNLGGRGLTETVKNEAPINYDLRVIFVDCIQKDQEKLSVTSDVLRAIFEAYNISPRFAGFITRQHMPGSTTRFDRKTYKPLRHELWYAAVIRSTWFHGDIEARDLSRKVADWRRFSLWSDYDLSTRRSNVVMLGCPPDTRNLFVSTFQGSNGMELRRHPMLIHAWFARHILLRTYDFLQAFSGPLYQWEFSAEEIQSAEDYTIRVKAFLALSRQIKQIATDYDVLDATLEHLQREHQWFEENTFKHNLETLSKDTTQFSMKDQIELRAPLQDVFESFLREAKLIRTYSTLYDDRTKIGVSEGFAMVNQRDADANIKIATESAQLTRASHADSRSLRVIQILSMLFLPSSLVSSIFGMGFFNTSQGNNGQAVFTISRNWWLWVAISLPLTVICLIILGGYNASLMERFTRRRLPETENGSSEHSKEK